jgi:uncharacterized protein (DUF1330 family)
MTIRLCVLLWPADGCEAELRAYEDAVLPLLAEHGGRLLARSTVVRASESEPLEVQLMELASQAELDAYLADPRRLALEAARERAISRTEILRLEATELT